MLGQQYAKIYNQVLVERVIPEYYPLINMQNKQCRE